MNRRAGADQPTPAAAGAPAGPRQGLGPSIVLREVEEYSQGLPADAREYWAQHRKRYANLTRLLVDLYATAAAPRRILDVGSSFQTLILARLFPDAHLATLGFEDARYRPRERTPHLEYDLNDAYLRDSWPRDEAYDLVLMLEVIEHLRTSPWRVLSLLRSLCKTDGRIVISTPNAAFLGNRVAMLQGRNPFEMLDDGRHRRGLGHFREYTRDELTNAAARAGLRPVRIEIDNPLLRSDSRGQRLFHRITRLLPQSCHQMMTVVFASDPGLAEPTDPAHVALELGEGWYAPESELGTPPRSWRWTSSQAAVSFDNPRRDVMLYLQIAGSAHGSARSQHVEIVVGSQIIDRLLTPPDRHAIHRIVVGAGAMGTVERVELKLRVAPAFVPAAVEGSDDTRELGVSVLRLAVAAL